MKGREYFNDTKTKELMKNLNQYFKCKSKYLELEWARCIPYTP